MITNKHLYEVCWKLCKYKCEIKKSYLTVAGEQNLLPRTKRRKWWKSDGRQNGRRAPVGSVGGHGVGLRRVRPGSLLMVVLMFVLVGRDRSFFHDFPHVDYWFVSLNSEAMKRVRRKLGESWCATDNSVSLNCGSYQEMGLLHSAFLITLALIQSMIGSVQKSAGGGARDRQTNAFLVACYLHRPLMIY